PCHISFIAMVSSVVCLSAGKFVAVLCVAFTLANLVLFVIGSHAQFRGRFRSLSNVNLSGSQNASKNAAAAAEKTEQSNGVLMPRPVTIPIANDKRRRPEKAG